MKHRAGHSIVSAVAIAAVVVLSCSELRSDELECEEAAARLSNCCPGFRVVPGYCVYAAGGCNGGGQFPALAVDESECIRGMSCSELVATNVCARAQTAVPRSGSYASPGARPSVCP